MAAEFDVLDAGAKLEALPGSATAENGSGLSEKEFGWDNWSD